MLAGIATNFAPPKQDNPFTHTTSVHDNIMVSVADNNYVIMRSCSLYLLYSCQDQKGIPVFYSSTPFLYSSYSRQWSSRVHSTLHSVPVLFYLRLLWYNNSCTTTSFCKKKGLLIAPGNVCLFREPRTLLWCCIKFAKSN